MSDNDRRKVIHVRDLVIKADNVFIEPRRHHRRADPFFGGRRDDQENDRHDWEDDKHDRDDQRDERDDRHHDDEESPDRGHHDRHDDDERGERHDPFFWI